MKITERETQQLVVSLNDRDAETIINGGSINGSEGPHVVAVHPLSDIDTQSRPIEPKDDKSVREALGSLTTRVTVLQSKIVIYVPESFAQSRELAFAEEINVDDIQGNTYLRPQGGVRVEFAEGDSDS